MRSELQGKTELTDVALGEERETTPELLRVRMLLRALPQVRCPNGFEFRLQRRIEGYVPRSRELNPARGWALGWTGVGLGFAASLVLALFVFDFEFSVSGRGQIAGSGVSSAPTLNQLPSTTPQLVSSPDASTRLEDAGQMAKAGTEILPPKDSVKQSEPVDLPKGLYHVVGGTGR